MNASAVGFGPADFLLPGGEADLQKWACVACDQYTSEPDYWRRVADFVGGAPSTLRLMLPECDLNQLNTRLPEIRAAMRSYLADGTLTERVRSSYVLVERTTASGVRLGLVGAVDLEEYDYSRGARALVRPTEKTIESRLPARETIRRGAPIELSHIMMLLDDPMKTVIEPLYAKRGQLTLLYDFELMEHGGHLRGWLVDGEGDQRAVYDALMLLRQKWTSYPLLFAVGDGNHSLATAKKIWESLKPGLTEEEIRTHPARWAMAEAVNIHDDGIRFEPIHRILTGVNPDGVLAEWETYCTARSMELIEGGGCSGVAHCVKTVTPAGDREFHIGNPDGSITADTIQRFLDWYVGCHKGTAMDYIHGEESLRELCKAPRTMGFLLPAIDKGEFFSLLERINVMPKKTFSIGEANEKRYYMECRRIEA